ncbi:hypothetical protein O3P69_010057 [Scylla paramamosain]|uniref:Uncharacterized protein n=1 Tax=Scylla paramamosain TaxID=85552 RepID=A0AAW0SPE1_SCYPA
MGGGRGRGSGPCGVCHVSSTMTCGGCGEMHYCGRDHQKRHWAQHRATCKPFKMVTHPDLGRYMVTTRRLKAGENVLVDQPLAFGPLPYFAAVCLGCHRLLPEELFRCPGCWWPLCSQECATSKLHERECPILAKDTEHVAVPQNNEETMRYDIIMVLRVLMLRESNPEGWGVVMNMEHHSEERAKETKVDLEINIHVLRNILGLNCAEKEVEQVRGAIATNAMQMTSPYGVPLRALHPRVHFFNHSCTPNLQLSFTTEGEMYVRTAVALEPGEPMYVTYTGTAMPLWERRACLRENYFFTCECKRCEDPNELDTDFSNPKCLECGNVIMKPHTWVGNIKWVCPNCKAEKSEQRVKEEVQTVLTTLDMSDVSDTSSIRRLQYLLEQVGQEFHPQHFVWMKVAQRMLHKLMNDETERGITLRVEIWKKLSVLYGKLEPGMTRKRGMGILEMALSMMKWIRNEYLQNSIYAPALMIKLKPVIEQFQEAADILSLEPAQVNVHVLAERALIRKQEACELMKEMERGDLLSRGKGC